MASDPPKVLISYSHDSPEHRDRVLVLSKRLRKDGIDCTIDQYVVVPPEGWPRWMEKQIRNSDFVLMVCTETYYRRVLGEEDPGRGRGVRWEGHLVYEAIYQADTRNTKFIPVLFEGGGLQWIPPVLQSTSYYDLSSEDGYENLYRRLTNQPRADKSELGKLRSLPPAERKSEGALGRLVNVPNLPPHFLPRPGDLQALKDAVLAGLTKAVALTGTGIMGVQGMGGIGKTVLATALAHDSEVRHAFPDGIYWLTIGQKPNVLALQNQLLRQLTGSKETLTAEQEAKNALREALEGRRALVVVDDAWTIDHADAFSVTGPPARLLITTRNNEVLVGLGAEEHRLDVLLPDDALKMLAQWVGEKSPDKLPPEAAEVAKECGYLPLALAMIGAMIRLRPTAWKDALSRLQRADLGAIKRAFPGYPYPDLLRAIEVSVEGLEPADRERYLDLAVFPEDQPIPEEALRVLWNLDEVDTRDCMTRFVARSLATWATGETSLILHDLQRDLIHKRRENGLPGLHLRLLEAWDALPKLPDVYAWRWIAYHMVKAGRKDDLQRLLLDFDYLQAKLSSTDTNALIADYNSFAEEEDLRVIQSAIRLSTNVLRDYRQLAGQLLGRLLGNRIPKIETMLNQAAESRAWPWLRPLQPSLTAPGGSLIRTLEGHTNRVNAVAVTPDGRHVVSGSDDKTLRVWDLATGETKTTLKGHSNRVNAVAVTADGRHVVSGSDDKTLRVWDLATGKTKTTLKGHTRSVYAVAVTPDGRHVVSGSDDKTLRVWDLAMGKTKTKLKGHSNRVNAVAVTPDGRHVVSGSADKTLRVWDLATGKTKTTLLGHMDSVSAVAVTADGRHVVSGSGSADKTLRVWHLENGQTLRTLEGHSYSVNAVAVTADGRHVVSGSDDETLRVWDLATGETKTTLLGHTRSVSAVAVTADGRHVVSGSDDKTLRVWDLAMGETKTGLLGHTDSVNAVAVTPDGRHVVSGSADTTLRVWDLATGETKTTLKGRTRPVYAVAVTPDGRHVVSGGSWYTTLLVWDLTTGETKTKLKGHSLCVRAVAVTPDGRHVVSGGLWDKTLRVWDLTTGEIKTTLKGHTDSVNAVAVTPDGHHVVSGSDDKTLRVWDLTTGKTKTTLKGHTDKVNAVAVTPDGRHVVSGSADTTLRVWDLATGETKTTLKGHTDSVKAVAVTPDGRHVISGSSDDTLRVWDLKDGKEILTFTVDGKVTACIAAQDNRTIVAGDSLGRVHFLRLVEADETKPAIGETKIQLLHRKEQAS